MLKCLKSTTPCLYADDTDIFTTSHDYDILVKNLNDDLKNLHTWLAKNKLQYHPTKTKLMFIGSPHNLKNRIGESCVFAGDKPIPVTHSFESLGVEIDENLTWDQVLVSGLLNALNHTLILVHYKLYTKR